LDRLPALASVAHRQLSIILETRPVEFTDGFSWNGYVPDVVMGHPYSSLLCKQESMPWHELVSGSVDACFRRHNGVGLTDR